VVIGKHFFPRYKTQGEDGVVSFAGLEVNADTAVTLLRQAGDQEHVYALTLFSHDREGKVFMLWDFDIDGQWDMR